MRAGFIPFSPCVRNFAILHNIMIIALIGVFISILFKSRAIVFHSFLGSWWVFFCESVSWLFSGRGEQPRSYYGNNSNWGTMSFTFSPDIWENCVSVLTASLNDSSLQSGHKEVSSANCDNSTSVSLVLAWYHLCYCFVESLKTKCQRQLNKDKEKGGPADRLLFEFWSIVSTGHSPRCMS